MRVVIAEDESIIRMDLKESLEEEGHEVVGEAATGEEAVALVEQKEPELAILDIKMPGMDGLTAAERIGRLGTTATVVLTAFSQRDLVERARDAGVMTYLVKPFQKEELIAAIELALARFQEAKALEREVEGLQERLEVRKLLDRAKGRLMDEFGLSEAESYRFIQRTAMSSRATMKSVAERIISGDLRP
jgi:AmiR/NasT family two-component response regulator